MGPQQVGSQSSLNSQLHEEGDQLNTEEVPSATYPDTIIFDLNAEPEVETKDQVLPAVECDLSLKLTLPVSKEQGLPEQEPVASAIPTRMSEDTNTDNAGSQMNVVRRGSDQSMGGQIRHASDKQTEPMRGQQGSTAGDTQMKVMRRVVRGTSSHNTRVTKRRGN